MLATKIPSSFRIRGVSLAPLVLSALLSTTSIAQSQSVPQLQITSPEDHAIVPSGQPLSVTVTSPTKTEFSLVAAVGPEPFGFSGSAKSLPAHFTFEIPAHTSSGLHSLYLMGLTVSDQRVDGPSIEVDIERPDMPLSLEVDFSTLYFGDPGERIPLRVLATFIDKSVVDVTESTYLTLESLDPSVASIDRGSVVSVAPGLTYVCVTYEKDGHRIKFFVQVEVPKHPDNFAGQFDISVEPGALKVMPGDTVEYKLSLSTFSRFAGPVDLKVAGIPKNATAAFSQASVSVPGSSKLTVFTSSATPTGIVRHHRHQRRPDFPSHAKPSNRRRQRPDLTTRMQPLDTVLLRTDFSLRRKRDSL